MGEPIVTAASAPAPIPAPTTLRDLDVERIRVAAERELFDALEKDPLFVQLRSRFEPPEPALVRRQLMGQSLRLTEGMAPEAFAMARSCLATLSIAKPIEIYQSSGRENAAIHLIEEPIVVEVQGRFLSLLDRGASRALFGHELGHYLAHGPKGPLGRGGAIANALAAAEQVPPHLQRLASALSMVKELTADRFGLLACQDLDALLRLEMISTTGLSGDALTWDTGAYLAQCRELMEQCLAQGDAVLGTTHPEHNLRVYAAWLFSETDVYRALTGKGPGTRRLDEVDATLARIIRRPDVDTTYHMHDELPRELHETALAASVLVALSDGEMADVESEAIERVFASLISDWRWYLNEENARQRFMEVGGVVAGGGPEIQRALFQLLLHVVMADGVIEEREVDMVVAIGDALGCGTVYRALLVPTLRQLGVDAKVPTTTTTSVPLPPRRGEAEAALELFLDGMLRRGGGETSLRRLLRLLGVQQRSVEKVAQVKRAIDRAQLRFDADLDGGDVDARLALTPRDGAQARDHRHANAPVAVDHSPLRGRLQRALGKLREQLISGDGRSPAVRLHRARSGRAFDLAALESVSVGLSERALALVRDGKTARLLDAAEVGKHDGARRLAAELVDLERENQARMDETGANDIFVGYPFLTGVVDGYLFRGPLVLYPVDLERDGRGARGFSLRARKDKDPVANQALVRLLFAKKKFSLPDELSAQLDELAAGKGPEAVLELVRQVGFDAVALTGQLVPLRDRVEEFASWSGAKNNRFEVEECAILGLFPQSASDLLQDYDGLLADLATGDPAALLEGALELLPADVRAALAVPDVSQPTLIAAERLTPVLHADPSQRAVLARARRARAMVVDGPPGTGKSQVIVNLVADAVGRGQRVAVVSEKRAALDVVVQRLEGVGMRHVLALVHDVFEDRRPLYSQIVARLERVEDRTVDESDLAANGAELERVTDALEARSRALAFKPPGHTLTVGQLHALVAGIAGAGVGAAESLVALDERSLQKLLVELVMLRPYADLFTPATPWQDPTRQRARPSLSDTSVAQLREIEILLDGAVATATALEDAQQRSPVPLGVVLSAQPALEAARATGPARATLDDQQLFLRLLETAAATPERLAWATEAESLWVDYHDAIERLRERVRFEAAPGVERALAILMAWSQRFLRFFLLAWWGARATVRKALLATWPERCAERLDATFVGEIQSRIKATRAWQAVDRAFDGLALRDRLPSSAALAGALVRQVGGLVRVVAPLGAARAQLAAVGAWPTATGAGTDAWDATLDERLSLLAARSAHARAAASVARQFPWIGDLPTSDTLRALADAWRTDAARVVEADRRLAAATHIHRGAPRLIDQLAAELPDADAQQWRLAIVKSWATSTLANLERTVAEQRLGETVAGHRDEHAAAEAMQRHVARASTLERDRVLARLDDISVIKAAQPEKYKRRNADQAVREGMLKEAKKQRNVMPLRTFARRFAGQGLLDLMPVWLLSPETMAVLFPREPLFDLVIFDEASQCPVENGLPAMLRARRTVIAGDEKQMPPTSFFTAQVSLDETPDAAKAEGTTDLLEEESLLTLARNRVEHAGLEWHYRCREEELIAFSNHAMYGGTLMTIPSTSTRTAKAAIRWIDVPDGEYDSGRNVNEARRVVTEMHDLLRRVPRPSVGVVTFNIQQRKAVLDEIDRVRATDADFATQWAAAMNADRLDERPFVKNLENVQGDERDVIVFSLGHAPVEREVKGRGKQRHVPSRFGPLGQRGGERRLNVAISRAKTECVIVSSFDPAMLSVANTTHDGPKLFKAFLEFARHSSDSRRVQAERVLALVRDGAVVTRAATVTTFPGYVPIKAQIASALDARKIAYELDVGTSRFRIPLAVVSRNDPGRYSVAVLSDEGEGAAPAFDTHVQWPLALSARGWKVVRVTSREWRQSPERQIERILSSFDGL